VSLNDRKLTQELSNKRVYCLVEGYGKGVKVTFNNISALSWWSVLLIEETKENHWPVTSHWQTLSHNVVSSTPRLSWFELTTWVVIGIDCISTNNVVVNPNNRRSRPQQPLIFRYVRNNQVYKYYAIDLTFIRTTKGQ